MPIKEKPIIGITMGDAAGIGPEIIVKSLSMKKIFDICRPIVVGDANVIDYSLRFSEVKLRINNILNVRNSLFKFGFIDVFDLNNIDLKELEMGKISVMSGKAAVEYINKAVELALAKEIKAIVTAPINKEAISKAGYDYPGHTEILSSLTKSSDYAMMLIAGSLRVIHVTTHVSLRKACDEVTKENVFKKIRLADKSLKEIGIEDPKIAVAGLNPHSGEGGLFGNEEVAEINPAIQLAKKKGINVNGPISPDTVFVRAKKNEFDVIVAMYHDQGHIPIKLEGFEEGVNITIGLPIIRTSVDHGTAFDIAGKGIANPTSLCKAIELAGEIAEYKISHDQSII
jgi:4-hydroxythreonine-4-phosphate dehydrogenase